MTDLDTLPKILQKATARANEDFGKRLPLDREQDFESATRGRIAPLPEGGIDGPGDMAAIPEGVEVVAPEPSSQRKTAMENEGCGSTPLHR